MRNTKRAIDAQIRLHEAARRARDLRDGRRAAALARGRRPRCLHRRRAARSRCAPAAGGCSRRTRWAPAAWATDPSTSVANPWGELHDTPGVWIGDASAFPTSSGTNPMVTLMALAHRTAEAIAATPASRAWRAPRLSAIRPDKERPHGVAPGTAGHATGSTSAASGSSRPARETIDVVNAVHRGGHGRASRRRRRGRRPRRRGRPRGVRVVVADSGRRAGRAAAPRSARAGRSAGGDRRARSPRELGMPIGLSRMIQAGLPTMTFARCRSSSAEIALRGAGRQLADRARAGRRRRRDHAVELPAAPDRGEGRARRWRRAARSSLKPSEVTPLNAFVLAEIIDEVGPAGGRVQPRDRAPARWSARRSPRTRASTWSRSPARPGAGRRVSELAAPTVKRVALELGGKSPNVILDDADLAARRRRRRRRSAS